MLNAAGYYTEPTPQNVAVSLLQDQVDTTDVNNPALYLTQNLQGVYTDPDPRTYPLSSYGYLILPDEVGNGSSPTAKGATLAAFSYYAMCQGQQQSAALGLLAHAHQPGRRPLRPDRQDPRAPTSRPSTSRAATTRRSPRRG